MEFGFFAQGAVPEPLRQHNPQLEHDRLMDSVEIAVRSEEWGFKYAWASEHHFLTEYSHMAAPEVWGAFVGARTSTLHVGSAITNTTPVVNHPVRVAEQIATTMMSDAMIPKATAKPPRWPWSSEARNKVKNTGPTSTVVAKPIASPSTKARIMALSLEKHPKGGVLRHNVGRSAHRASGQ